MNRYDDPPACRECGGYLGSAGEMCACGGVSQYRESRVASYGSVSRYAPDEGTTERRAMTWEDAMRQLRARYVEP